MLDNRRFTFPIAEKTANYGSHIRDERFPLGCLSLVCRSQKHLELGECVIAYLLDAVAPTNQLVDRLIQPTARAYFVRRFTGLFRAAFAMSRTAGFLLTHDFMKTLKSGGSFWVKKL